MAKCIPSRQFYKRRLISFHEDHPICLHGAHVPVDGTEGQLRIQSVRCGCNCSQFRFGWWIEREIEREWGWGRMEASCSNAHGDGRTRTDTNAKEEEEKGKREEGMVDAHESRREGERERTSLLQ